MKMFLKVSVNIRHDHSSSCILNVKTDPMPTISLNQRCAKSVSSMWPEAGATSLSREEEETEASALPGASGLCRASAETLTLFCLKCLSQAHYLWVTYHCVKCFCGSPWGVFNHDHEETEDCKQLWWS